MHAFYELYGASLTGNLFTALAKLLSAHLQMHGFTCGMDDLLVHKDTDAKRISEIKKAHIDGV
jgi:DNA-directed RNA polymerase I subunit RPA1